MEWARGALNFKLGLGNEIYLCRDGLSKDNFVKGEDKFWHFILIAKDKEGHHQIRQLSSRAWEHSFRQFMERVPTYYSDVEDVIGEDKGHLIASSACLGGYFPKLIFEAESTGNYRKVDNFTTWCQDMFEEDFYIEIQPGLSQEQILFNKLAVSYAKANNIKFIVTTDTHYLREGDRAIHKSFLNAGEGDREVDDFYAYTYLMDYQEVVEKLSASIGETAAREALENTLEVGEKIGEYDLSKKQVIPKIPLNWTGIEPVKLTSDYLWIDKFITSPFEEDRLYIAKILKGLKEKNIWDKPHLERIDLELEQIWELSKIQEDRLSNYFITMQKIIDIIWENDSIVGVGRGSVFTHLCSYAIDIVQADPLTSPIELPYWRFLSKERPELPDIDTDFEASKKKKITEIIRQYFKSIGGDFIAVGTYRTETSKAALLTAARGLNYDNEVGSYLSSLVPIDRGFVRSLSQCFYGDEEKDYKPIPQFVLEMNSHKDIWEVAQTIEGLISGRGRHACGSCPLTTKIEDFTAAMRAPDGGFVSQYELSCIEKTGALKYDYLNTDCLDRIHQCMNLLLDAGKIEWQGSLRKTYNKYLHPSVLNYTEKEMWDLVENNKVFALFQMDSPQAAITTKLIKPHSLGELAQTNSLLRLMPEKGKETPSEEYVRFKNNIDLFYQEVESLDGTRKEKDALIEVLGPLYGIADGQEGAMRLLMHPDLFGFSIREAHGARKLIAKKKIKEISAYRENLYKIGKEKGISSDIIHYVWDVQIGRQLGYSFEFWSNYIEIYNKKSFKLRETLKV